MTSRLMMNHEPDPHYQPTVNIEAGGEKKRKKKKKIVEQKCKSKRNLKNV